MEYLTTLIPSDTVKECVCPYCGTNAHFDEQKPVLSVQPLNLSKVRCLDCENIFLSVDVASVPESIRGELMQPWVIEGNTDNFAIK